VEMRDLGQGVRPRIGTPGANRADPLAGDPGQCPLERILHPAALRMGLPAAEAAGAVLHSQRDSHALTLPIQKENRDSLHCRGSICRPFFYPRLANSVFACAFCSASPSLMTS